jgi:hypothetical protein
MVFAVYTMKRKQIYIDPDQDDELRRLARTRDVSVSVLIREAVAEYLAEQGRPRFERPEDHPLWRIVGIVDDPDVPTDASINLDHYLYGAPKRVE